MPKGRVNRKGGGEFERVLVPEGKYLAKIAGIGEARKTSETDTKGKVTHWVRFEVIGGEYSKASVFKAFDGLVMYAVQDDEGHPRLNDIGFPVAYRLHPKSIVWRLIEDGLGLDLENADEGQDIDLNLPTCLLGTQWTIKVSHYLSDKTGETTSQVYSWDDVEPVQAITAKQMSNIQGLLKDAFKQGYTKENWMAFLESNGIPAKKSEMENWTGQQAILAIEHLNKILGAQNEEPAKPDDTEDWQ